LGVISGLRFGSPRVDIPTIHGQIIIEPEGNDKDVPKAEQVTLRNCYQSNRNEKSSGISTEKMFARRAYFGGYLNEEVDYRFRSANLQFSGLGAWAEGSTGFVDRGNGSFGVSWAHPADIVARVDLGQLRLATGCSAEHSLQEHRFT